MWLGKRFCQPRRGTHLVHPRVCVGRLSRTPCVTATPPTKAAMRLILNFFIASSPTACGLTASCTPPPCVRAPLNPPPIRVITAVTHSPRIVPPTPFTAFSCVTGVTHTPPPSRPTTLHCLLYCVTAMTCTFPGARCLCSAVRNVRRGIAYMPAVSFLPNTAPRFVMQTDP